MGGETRESLTSSLPSRSSDPKVWGVAARVRTKLLARVIPHFACHSLVFLSVQYYERNLGLAGHLVAGDPLLQECRSSEIKILHTFSNV